MVCRRGDLHAGPRVDAAAAGTRDHSGRQGRDRSGSRSVPHRTQAGVLQDPLRSRRPLRPERLPHGGRAPLRRHRPQRLPGQRRHGPRRTRPPEEHLHTFLLRPRTTISPTLSPRRSPTPPSSAAMPRRSSRWPATPTRRPRRSAGASGRPSGSPSGSSSFLYLNLTKKDSLPRRARVYCRVCERGDAEDFVGKISRALEGAGRRGIHVTAGAGSCDLEAQQFGMFPPEEEQIPVARPHHLESPVGPRDLGGHDGTSRLCYFLDGVQSSREIGRIEMSPVAVARAPYSDGGGRVVGVRRSAVAASHGTPGRPRRRRGGGR